VKGVGLFTDPDDPIHNLTIWALSWKNGRGGVSYSTPNTTLTLYGGTDCDLATSLIIEPNFSAAIASCGFSMDEAQKEG
jgi:hypothetical protein